jgi:dTDP-4-dehydrorhamnose 3,5-epimerase
MAADDGAEESPAEALGLKDEPHIDSDWVVQRDLIDGVRTREVRHIITGNGVTTELYRPDWGVLEGEVRHMVHVALRGGVVTAWHQHHLQTDHIFVVSGTLRIVLYDPREDSPTVGQVDVFNLSHMRPTLLAIPPFIWHGVQNLEPTTSTFVNFFDRPYDYGDPDEYRVPLDSPDIPYSFG